MFFLLGGNDKKAQKQNTSKTDAMGERVRELFLNGKLPVVTTPTIEGKDVSKVLGLVCCRGYDSEEAFFGMASRAVGKGAHAIVGYMENVAFHPDGSKYFSCFGTAVMFNYEPEERYGAAVLMQRPTPKLDDTVTLSQSAVASQVRAATEAPRARNEKQNVERREQLSQTRLGLDPEDVAPRKRRPQVAAEAQDSVEKEEYFNPASLQADEPIRKFRTQ